MYFKDIGQIFVNFSAPLQPFWIFLSWVTLCDLCGHFEYHKPIFYDKFFFGSPLSWGRLRLQKNAKMRMFLKHFGIFFTWFLFTCVSHIFDLSGNTKYELLCFTTRLTSTSVETTQGHRYYHKQCTICSPFFLSEIYDTSSSNTYFLGSKTHLIQSIMTQLIAYRINNMR